MIVDGSTLVAILLEEPGYERLIRAIEAADTLATHPISIYEATAAMLRALQGAPEIAAGHVTRLLRNAGIEIVPITAETAEQAVVAFARFGKGRHLRASLNMGDCFSYAVARSLSQPILYAGDDFSHPDLPAVRA